MWTRGDKLPERLRAAVLRQYVYRMTVESVRERPDVADYMRRGGYRLPIITDAQWLENKAFYVTKRGELSARHRYCQSAEMGELDNGQRSTNNAQF